MLVKKLLETKEPRIVTAEVGTTIDQAMESLITNDIGCLPVVDGDGKLTGIVTDRDIFRKIHDTKGDYHNVTIGDIMSRNVIVGVLNDDINYIAGVMYKNKIRHIPIVDQGQMIGVISLRDINKTLVTNSEIENRYLRLFTDGTGVRDFSADH